VKAATAQVTKSQAAVAHADLCATLRTPTTSPLIAERAFARVGSGAGGDPVETEQKNPDRLASVKGLAAKRKKVIEDLATERSAADNWRQERRQCFSDTAMLVLHEFEGIGGDDWKIKPDGRHLGNSPHTKPCAMAVLTAKDMPGCHVLRFIATQENEIIATETKEPAQDEFDDEHPAQRIVAVFDVRDLQPDDVRCVVRHFLHRNLLTLP
jgi:hypothetical protein